MLNDGINNERLTDNACFKELASSSDLRKLLDDAEKVVCSSQLRLMATAHESVMVNE